MKEQDKTDTTLEQYKLYVELSDRLSARRAQDNKFFISLTSAIIALASFSGGLKALEAFWPVIVVVFSMIGRCLNSVWRAHLDAYRQLNSAKFKVIHDLEECLSHRCFKNEWDFVKKEGQVYKGLTNIEKRIANILDWLYYLGICIGSIAFFVKLFS